MEGLLCDELLQEIFFKLPLSSSSSVSLVSKRWLHLYRTSRTSLSLRLASSSQSSAVSAAAASLSSFLSHYPSLSSLSLFLSSDLNTTSAASSADHLLATVASSCSNLRHIRFSTGPVSLSPLLSLSRTSPRLTSLTVSLSRPVSLRWVLHFPCLKELSISVFSGDDEKFEIVDDEDGDFESELGLESLCLAGIRGGDRGFGWLYRNCKNLKKLQMKSCEGIGDGGLFSSFVPCLQRIEHVELRTCRSIVDGVLSKLSENSNSLNSLLVYDGGSRDALLHFITNSGGSHLRKLDLRLPLDLKNDHLFALASNFRNLATLRLQSCCLVTGDGLKSLAVAISGLEELALINCDVVEREPGLLATLGQNMKSLKKLDLSYNEMLPDKEIVAMLVSCESLVELKLRGCKGITMAAMGVVWKSCKDLEELDIVGCCGIPAEAVEVAVASLRRLKRLRVEEFKVSDCARRWACNRWIEVVV